MTDHELLVWVKRIGSPDTTPTVFNDFWHALSTEERVRVSAWLHDGAELFPRPTRENLDACEAALEAVRRTASGEG